MKTWLIVILCLNFSFVIAQNVNDVDKINLGITYYPFTPAPNSVSSNSVGASAYFNGERLTMQFGVLFYQATETSDLTPISGYFETDEITRAYFLFLFHYSYFKNNKINCFLTGGITVGDQFDNEENSNAKLIHLVVGTGVSYNLFSRFYLRASPTLQYDNEQFYYGLLLDLSISINHKRPKN